MLLRYISVPALIGEAGGDPWAINASLLSGFNQESGNVEVRVTNDPTKLLGRPTIVVAQQSNPRTPNLVPQNFGGFILLGSTLDKLNLLAANGIHGTTRRTKNTQEFQLTSSSQWIAGIPHAGQLSRCSCG
jgi:hypothetical protein